MGLFKFGGKKQTPEERAEMLYTKGLTLKANRYWIYAVDVIKQAADMVHGALWHSLP